MKKYLLIAFVLLFVPYTALAEMAALDNNEMDSISGQIGIDISIANGDLDIEANADINANGILGMLSAGGAAQLNIVNNLDTTSPGQTFDISLLSGGNLVGVTMDLGGLGMDASVTDLAIGAAGFNVANINGSGNIALNRLKVTAGIGL